MLDIKFIRENKKQVKEFDICLDCFYQKLVVHGILHLYGYTHGKKKESNENGAFRK